MQTFLYPAALQVRKIPNGDGSRPRTAYVIRNGRLTLGRDRVQHTGDRYPSRGHAHHQQRPWGLYRIYALAKRDGVRLQPHSAEFDRQYMVKLFEYGRAKARSDYPLRGAPPGF
jgi:transposase